MNSVDPPSCKMTSTELDRVSRAHFEFVVNLLKTVQARYSAETEQPSKTAFANSDT